MSEEVVILMIGISTLLGAIGLAGLIWAVRTGQFDDHNKFLDAVRHDNLEDLQDAVMMQKRKEQYQQKRKQKQQEKEKNYRPAD